MSTVPSNGTPGGDYDPKKKHINTSWDAKNEYASKIALYHECFHYADDWMRGVGINIKQYKKIVKANKKSYDKCVMEQIAASSLSDDDLLRYVFYELMPIEAKADLFAYWMNKYFIEYAFVNKMKQQTEIYDRLYGMPCETYREAWNSFSGLFRHISRKDAEALRSYVLKASSALGSCYEKKAKRNYVVKQMESLDNSIYHVLGID